MTGPDDSPGTRPLSVAELLAKNGTIGAPPPVTGRRRRRRGNSDAVTVAELTGEIPIVGDDLEHEATEHRGPGTHARPAYGGAPPAESVAEDRAERREGQRGAEGMSPDPPEDYAGMPVDVMDTEVRQAAPVTEDSAYVRSYLRPGLFFGAMTAAGDVDTETADDSAADVLTDVEEAEGYPDLADAGAALAAGDKDAYSWPSRTETMLRGGLVVVQSILAVAFGGGLFIAFDQLWRWNNIVALVLSVLVILGLVVGVRVVRKTEDIASTLIAVAVGALVTLGPLALSQSG